MTTGFTERSQRVFYYRRAVTRTLCVWTGEQRPFHSPRDRTVTQQRRRQLLPQNARQGRPCSSTVKAHTI